MENLKFLLFKRLFNFWKNDTEDDTNLEKQLRELIFESGENGAETLLDFCREDFENIPLEEQDNAEHEELNKVWDLCNWYLDLLQHNNIEEEWLIDKIKNY